MQFCRGLLPGNRLQHGMPQIWHLSRSQIRRERVSFPREPTLHGVVFRKFGGPILDDERAEEQPARVIDAALAHGKENAVTAV